MRRRITVLLCVAVGVAAAFAPAALAEPFAYAATGSGDVTLVSSVLFSQRSVELNGGWFDDTISCLEERQLRVKVQIERTVGSKTRRISYSKIGPVQNCAEGGPNFGYFLRPKALGLACSGGRWKPGRYVFLIKTTYLDTGLQVMGSLYLNRTAPCGA